MAREGEARIWTIPNALSLARLAGVALFCYLLFGPNDRILAAAVLAVTGITDFFDGFIARRLNQVTTIGKVLDPTADRIVVTTGVISILVYGAVPVWLGTLVLTREVLVSAAVLLLAALGSERIDVIWAGKAGTFGLMGCFPLFLWSDGPGTFLAVVRDTTWVLVVPALAFSLYAALCYVPLARNALTKGRAGRETDPVRSAP
jgi:cardiolipin synthase